MIRSPRHECPREAPSDLDGRLHESQAGDARHRCTTCAYWAGNDAGSSAASDRRRSSWPSGDGERCVRGHAAPYGDLFEIPRSQGTGRHLCAICAWTCGWQDAVGAAR